MKARAAEVAAVEEQVTYPNLNDVMVIKVAVERYELMRAFAPLAGRFPDLIITVGKSLSYVAPMGNGLHVVCDRDGLTLEHALAVVEAEALRRDAFNEPNPNDARLLRVHGPMRFGALGALADEFAAHVKPRIQAVRDRAQAVERGAGVYLLGVAAPTESSTTLEQARAILVDLAGVDPATIKTPPQTRHGGAIGHAPTAWGGPVAAPPSALSQAFREGEKVGYEGRRTENPYGWGSREHNDWNRGHGAGSEDDD